MSESANAVSARFALVIFDCDGVLVDSEVLGNRILVEMVAELGLALDLEEAVALFRGCKMAECVREIERRMRRPVPGNFVNDLRTRTADAFRLGLQPVHGVETLIDALRVPICVASSGPSEKIRLSLQVTGLLPRFDGRIFSAYDVGVWKPDPGLFLHAARVMGVAPRKCAVVEDSVLGVRAGVAAGMAVFGFAADGRDSNALCNAGAVVFQSMQQLTDLLACR
ncbi:MAG TPA: HAD-IA family hydrolase [Tepidisphaeraceae bacterium]|jgi:HAD superfamily hydrolase (TIGR01509 family)